MSVPERQRSRIHEPLIRIKCCNNLGIPRGLTAPYTPQQNGPVESALWRAYKAGHAACLRVSNIYPNMRLEEVKGADVAATNLWMESLLWASGCFSRSAMVANERWLFLHKIFYESHPPLPLLPFFQPAYHRVPRQCKSEPRARLCYFLNLGYNQGCHCYKLLGTETGKVTFSRDFTWHHPEAPLILPATAVGNPPAAPPEDIYIPMPTYVPIFTCSRSSTDACTRSALTSTSTTPPPPTMSQPPAQIPLRVGRELQHEG